MFDLTSLYSFNNIKHWLEEINLHLYSNKTKKRCDFYLVGNKSDQKKGGEDKSEEYKKYCLNNQINGLYYEMSALNSNQISNLFTEIITNILIHR
jgi:predicted GTPase